MLIERSKDNQRMEIVTDVLRIKAVNDIRKGKSKMNNINQKSHTIRKEINPIIGVKNHDQGLMRENRDIVRARKEYI